MFQAPGYEERIKWTILWASRLLRRRELNKRNFVLFSFSLRRVSPYYSLSSRQRHIYSLHLLRLVGIFKSGAPLARCRVVLMHFHHPGILTFNCLLNQAIQNQQKQNLLSSISYGFSFRIFSSLLDSPSGPRPSLWRSAIKLRHTTLGRTPLDEWTARRRDLYQTTHNTHKRQTSIPPAI